VTIIVKENNNIKNIVKSNITFIQPFTLVIHYSDPNHAFNLVQGCKLQEPSKYPWGFQTWDIMFYLSLFIHSIDKPIISLWYWLELKSYTSDWGLFRGSVWWMAMGGGFLFWGLGEKAG